MVDEELPVGALEEEAENVDVDAVAVVGLGEATPVRCGMLAAPAATSTMLLVVEFRWA